LTWKVRIFTCSLQAQHTKYTRRIRGVRNQASTENFESSSTCGYSSLGKKQSNYLRLKTKEMAVSVSNIGILGLPLQEMPKRASVNQ
jgi:hypothetical protein